MKVGDTVRVVVPVVEGQIAKRRINEDSDEPEALVVFGDGSGEVHQRWVLETQLEKVS